MYKLYYTDGVERRLLCVFVGSPFWTSVYELAKKQFGEENLDLQFDADLKNLIS